MKTDVGPWLWALFGAALLAAGAWLLRDGFARTGWPSVEAEALGARVESRREQRRMAGTTYHDVVVTVRFPAASQVVTASVVAESHLDRGPAEYWASKRYAKGTRHRVWFDPADPRQVETRAPDLVSLLIPAVPMLIIGALAATIGVRSLRRIH